MAVYLVIAYIPSLQSPTKKFTNRHVHVICDMYVAQL